jgi:midasin
MSTPTPPIDALVPVATSARNLRAIALALCTGRPVLLAGPAGCGKSVLLRHVARLTQHEQHWIQIHLDDQIDSKVLLGTYVCTDIPGEFRWQAGALTQAVQQGRWALLEDIDRAPFEVLSAILPLLERRQLYLPGRGEVIDAAPGFQLFATLSTSGSSIRITADDVAILGGKVAVTATNSSGANSRSHMESAAILENHFLRVALDSLTIEELTVIIQHKFPNLVQFIAPMVRTFAQLSLNPTELLRSLAASDSTDTPAVSASSSASAASMPDAVAVSVPLTSTSLSLGTRRLTTRDLFKWCTRVHALFNERGQQLGANGITIEEEIFSEALDCFTSSVPSIRARALLWQWLAHMWQLPKDRAQYYLSMYKPSIVTAKESITIGRISLARDEKLSVQLATSHGGSNFSHTKHSSRLLEKLAIGIARNEPLLLVGDTGNGKTSVIQHLAQQLGRKLMVQNLNQQTDSSDFLGGFKPVELRSACIPLMHTFGQLFPKTFSKSANQSLVEHIKKAFDEKHWVALVAHLKSVYRMVEDKHLLPTHSGADAGSNKRSLSASLREDWCQFGLEVRAFEKQLAHLKNNFAFWFAEGTLVKAMREGCWLLLDEINLASSETLERLSGILDSPTGSLVLLERGDARSLPRHPGFRLLASMNPPTDFGKKDLPAAIRSKFTELYVDDVRDPADLSTIVRAMLKDCAAQVPVDDVVTLYLECVQAAGTTLVDGADQRPHYSVRSLSRALDYCRVNMHIYGFQRSLYEGFAVSFLMPLQPTSRAAVELLMVKYILKGKSVKVLEQMPKDPTVSAAERFVALSNFWVPTGSEALPAAAGTEFIITASIQSRIHDLARVLVAAKYPVLLQGPTSAGKTSVVLYLAKLTGHRCVRINNHEHTDLQEYMGSYVTGMDGKLKFQEGILVEAVRKGYWIILDELNLAPSDVLEALNRLLDDNRELFIPETQETVKPHKHFMLFATQNPPGLYGGRKVLSRAFRNRFVEVHVDDIPEDELVTILHDRCSMPPKFCQAMVNSMKELQRRRQRSHVFAGKRGFITPRDLFRWGMRQPSNEQELGEVGYMLLGERLRSEDEKLMVKEVLQKFIKCKLDDSMYDRVPIAELSARVQAALAAGDESVRGLNDITWTPSMRRLYMLLHSCIQFSEPVLLVGETGCGKTTICQIIALLRFQRLRIMNCHQNTETSDFLGSLRPIRGKNRVHVQLRQRIREFLQIVTQCQQRLLVSAPLMRMAATHVDSTTTAVPATASSATVPSTPGRNGHSKKRSSDEIDATTAESPVRGTATASTIVSWHWQSGDALDTVDLDDMEPDKLMELLDHVVAELAKVALAMPEAFTTVIYQLFPSSSVSSVSSSSTSVMDVPAADAAEITTTHCMEDDESVPDSKRSRKKKEKKARAEAPSFMRPVAAELLPVAPPPSAASASSASASSASASSASANVDFDLDAAASAIVFDESDPVRFWPVPLQQQIKTIRALRARMLALFEWQDGALVNSMKQGDLFLIDEISLAEDAVLERLNSVLEPSRTLLLVCHLIVRGAIVALAVMFVV